MSEHDEVEELAEEMLERQQELAEERSRRRAYRDGKILPELVEETQQRAAEMESLGDRVRQAQERSEKLGIGEKVREVQRTGDGYRETDDYRQEENHEPFIKF
ncbi:MAG: hypothetical protein ABEK01_05290 [Candidatus Nanohaloarchaea archaeon]